MQAWTTEIGKYMTGRNQQDQRERSGLVKELGPSLWNTSSAFRCTASRPLKVLVSKCHMRSKYCKEQLCSIGQLYIVWLWPRPRESTKSGQGLGQELMLQRGEVILKCSNTDSQDFFRADGSLDYVMSFIVSMMYF